jgi:hypothetical protein
LFCRRCGTQLALRDEPDCLDVTLASLDNSEAVRPNYHLDGEPDQLVEIADDLPRYPGSPRAKAMTNRAGVSP